MDAQYNWIDIMENRLFNFVADVKREGCYLDLFEVWFDSGCDDLDGSQKEMWIVLNQMKDTDDRRHYTDTVKGLLNLLEDTYDEHGVLLTNTTEDEDDSEDDYDDSNDVLPKNCVDGWVKKFDEEPTECPICYEIRLCSSPLDWNTNARCCHKLCASCVVEISKSDNHNCPQCRRKLCPWFAHMRL